MISLMTGEGKTLLLIYLGTQASEYRFLLPAVALENGPNLYVALYAYSLC